MRLSVAGLAAQTDTRRMKERTSKQEAKFQCRQGALALTLNDSNRLELDSLLGDTGVVTCRNAGTAVAPKQAQTLRKDRLFGAGASLHHLRHVLVA